MNAALAETIEVLPPAASAITEFNQTAAGLAQLRADIEGRTFDCSTTAGDKEARGVRLNLVTLRTTIEGKRKELKAPLLERGKLIDSEAARIIGEVKALEEPIDAVIRAAEAEREARRMERERAEAERLAAINAQIDRIRNMPSLYVTATSAVVAEAIAELQGMDLAALFDDVHRPRAAEALAEALESLTTIHNERIAAAAEAARLAEERAELERQQAAAKEAQRKADEEAAAARAEADRIAQAERDRLDAIARAEQEQRERELAEREAAVRAEQERIEAEARAERERQDRELAERAAALRAEEEAFAAEQKAAVEQAEAAYIANANLREAAEQAFILLDWLAPDHLITRALGAALERDA